MVIFLGNYASFTQLVLLYPNDNCLELKKNFDFRQTVKNAGRGFAPDTQDDDIVDEVKDSAQTLYLYIYKNLVVFF